MTSVEIVRLKVAPRDRRAFEAARREMVADFETDRRGFLSARLVELHDGDYLDVVEWASSADFAESRAKGANLPGIRGFFDLIEEVVDSAEGVLVETSAP